MPRDYLAPDKHHRNPGQRRIRTSFATGAWSAIR